MGGTSGKIVIKNETKNKLEIKVSNDYSNQWHSSNPEQKFSGKEIEAGRGRSAFVDLLVMLPCTFEMTFTFEDGSEDVFTLNMGWAGGFCDFGLRKTKFQHIVLFHRYINEWSLDVVVKNTELQKLAYHCVESLIKAESLFEDYKKKPKTPKEMEQVAYGDLKASDKILLPLLDDLTLLTAEEQKDEPAKKIANTLWNRAHVLSAKIKEQLSEKRLQESIKFEIDEESDMRVQAKIYMKKSKEILEEAIKESKASGDSTLEGELEKKLPRYKMKQDSNDLFNKALEQKYIFYKIMSSFNSMNKITNRRSNDYYLKYKTAEKVLEMNKKTEQQFEAVSKSFDELIKKDKRFEYCNVYVKQVIDLCKKIYPDQRKTQLQLTLRGLQQPKNEECTSLWKGEELVELKSPTY